MFAAHCPASLQLFQVAGFYDTSPPVWFAQPPGEAFMLGGRFPPPLLLWAQFFLVWGDYFLLLWPMKILLGWLVFLTKHSSAGKCQVLKNIYMAIFPLKSYFCSLEEREDVVTVLSLVGGPERTEMPSCWGV